MKTKILLLLAVLGFAGTSQAAIVVMGGAETVAYSSNEVVITCGDDPDRYCAIINFDEGGVTVTVGQRVYHGQSYIQDGNVIKLEG